MKQTTPNTMQAAAIDRFGGIETITLQTLPVPEVGPDEVLIRVESAGVARGIPSSAKAGSPSGSEPNEKFPYVLGTDGAGTVVQVGEKVKGFKEGDRVYAAVLANPKGGFYAEFAAVKADNVSRVPEKLTTEQAGVMPSDALTALRGLDDMLGLKPGETLLIFGAGGGIGHLAVQLAKRMGARVLALASGDRRRGAGSAPWCRRRGQRSQGRRGGRCPRVRARRPRCRLGHRRRRDGRSGAGGAVRRRARRLPPRRGARAEGPPRRAYQQLRRQHRSQRRSPSSTA